MLLEENIRRHKKIFESPKISDFNININNNIYKIVYYQLGVIRGYLVLFENGDVCPRDKAIKPFEMVIQLNSYMNGFYTNGLAEIQKPTHAFQETIKLAEEVKPMIKNNRNELDSVISDISQLEQGFNRLKQIYSQADKIYKEILNSKELNQENLEEIVSFTNEFSI